MEKFTPLIISRFDTPISPCTSDIIIAWTTICELSKIIRTQETVKSRAFIWAVLGRLRQRKQYDTFSSRNKFLAAYNLSLFYERELKISRTNRFPGSFLSFVVIITYFQFFDECRSSVIRRYPSFIFLNTRKIRTLYYYYSVNNVNRYQIYYYHNNNKITHRHRVTWYIKCRLLAEYIFLSV